MNAYTYSSEQWQSLLERRGIFGEAKRHGWRSGVYGGQSGWLYPIYDEHGKEVSERFKNFDSHALTHKYAWPKPKVGDYYLLPDVLSAISEANGVAFLASGEPDVLAFRSAGTKNVLCWFGERAIPVTLAQDLARFGVKSVNCYPDRDETGFLWAKGILERLRNTLIYTNVYELPRDVDTKYDINQLWIDSKFHQDEFWNALVECKEFVIKLDPIQQSLADVQKIDVNSEYKGLPKGYVEAIERTLHIEPSGNSEWSKMFCCPLHEETNPSAHWHMEKKILKCFVCHGDNEHALAKEVGEKLGIHLSDFFDKKPIDVSYAPSRPKPASKPTIVSTWDQASDKLTAELNGDVPALEPLTLPFKSLASLGGFAKRIEPGKVIAIVADSGIGKSSLIETIEDHWRQNDYSGVVWGPEWTDVESVERGVQRRGGPSFERFGDNRAYLSEMKRGVPLEKRTGIPFTPQERKDVDYWIADMKAWKGRLHFVNKMELPIISIVHEMIDVVAVHKANGSLLRFAVLDYVQLLNFDGDTNSAIGQALNCFKGFCVDYNLVGIVASQVNKGDGRASQSGGKGDQHSMSYARSNVFNLAMVVTREVLTDGSYNPVANCRVVKNSLGKAGDRKLYLNEKLMRWFDLQPESNQPKPIVSDVSVAQDESEDIPF